MTNPWEKGFLATAYWGLRSETSESCAARFQRSLSALSQIHPTFSEWLVLRDPVAAMIADSDEAVEYWSKLSDAEIEARIVPLMSLNEREVIDWISDEISRNDDKTPDPRFGYYFNTSTGPEKHTRPRTWTLSIHAGDQASSHSSFVNRVDLESQLLCAANADLNTLQIFKPAMFALARTWEASWCGLRPAWSLPEDSPRQPWFGFQWATYLGPALAKRVTPPQSAQTERFADGGLLMVATEDRFDPNNSKHMAAAQAITAALAPAGIVPSPTMPTPGPR